MSVDAAPDTPYAQKIQADKDNRPLTENELDNQIESFKCQFCTLIDAKKKQGIRCNQRIVMAAHEREDTPAAANTTTFVKSYQA